jgi:hypothetical protein
LTAAKVVPSTTYTASRREEATFGIVQNDRAHRSPVKFWPPVFVVTAFAEIEIVLDFAVVVALDLAAKPSLLKTLLGFFTALGTRTSK